ncbi:MAG: homoserine kinase, partial [Candidatus Angelobacter sp. Gp1-AA117]
GALTIRHQGNTAERVPCDDSNLLLRAMRLAANRLGQCSPQGRIIVDSKIPVGVGMGSSAAAVVAGLLLGAAQCGKPVETGQLLRWAEEIEGHIDNAAAACLGGLAFALCNNTERVITFKTRFPDDIRLVLVTPSVPVPTREARRVLPQNYDRADVLHTLQRTSLLAATCASGKFDLVPELFDDRLHHPYRQQLVPGIARALEHRQEGLLGVAISGSGSSVIAFTRGNEEQIARELQRIFRQEGVETEVLFTSADNQGAVVRTVPPDSSQAARQ